MSRRIYKEYGVELSELQKLKQFYLVYFEKETAISKLSEEQTKLLEKIGVDLC